MIPESAPQFPRSLNVETTNRCNLDCVMCPRKKMTRAEGTMDMELYRKIVADCAGYVQHIGAFLPFMDGEPLMDSLLEERIRIAKDAGIKFTQIATNGTLLTPSRSRSLIESGLDSVIISLDHIHEQGHEDIRRGARYDRIVSNVDSFVAIRDEAGSRSPQVTVRMLDMGLNTAATEPFMEHWRSRVERVTVVPAHNWGGAVPFGGHRSHPNTECWYLWGNLVILVDGTVALCCLDYDGAHKLGDVRHESIYDIWHGEKFSEYRDRFRNGRIDLCSRCNWVPDLVIADTAPGKGEAGRSMDRHPEQRNDSPALDAVQAGHCVVCGREASFHFDGGIITPQLKHAWGITEQMVDAFNRRESMRCSVCGSSLRIRRLCSALIQTVSEITGQAYRSFVELLANESFRSMRIAEINACGALHDYLKQHPNLSYSEYAPHLPRGSEHNGIRCEDLQQLTYPDDYFDIILTSDTLEHVPDPDKAWSEIRRTLKPGGYHIFTVPVVPSQPVTRQRARFGKEHIEHLDEPAYHGGEWGAEDQLVYTDFAMDIADTLNGLGLDTHVLCYEQDATDVAFVFRSQKQETPAAAKQRSSKLESTGERFLPWMEGARIQYEHLHRYAFAARLVKGRKVLDLACGEGYGTYMLAREAEYVAGLDIDEQTVLHAGSRYLRDNLEFMQGSMLDIPIEGNRQFDVIVCFEGLEHIAEHDRLLSEVKRLLKDDGLFVVSTPNKAVYTDAPDYHNPFHVKELYVDEFKSLLGRYFTNMLLFGQRVYAGSNLWSIHKHSSRGFTEAVVKKGDREFYLAERDQKEPVYLIAIAADTELKALSSLTDSWLTDASDALFGNYERQVARLDRALQDKTSRIADLESSLKEKTARVTSLETRAANLETRAANLDARAADLETRAADLDAQAADLETQLAGMKKRVRTLEGRLAAVYASYSWRITRPLRATADAFRLDWFLLNARRGVTLLTWLCTGQFSRAGNALLPYYLRFVPQRVRGMVPRRLRARLLRRLEEPPAHRDSAVAGTTALGRSRDSVLNLTGYGSISKVLDYSSPTPDPVLQQDSICLHLHLFYTDLADHFAQLLSRLHQDYTLLVSVPEDQDTSRWQTYFSERLQRATGVIVKSVPNRGRDASPWVVTFADEIQKHTIFCHLHAKKSHHADRLRDWRPFLEHSMFGSRHLINQILLLFLEDTSLGLVYPPYFGLLRDRQPAWGKNKEQFAMLYRRLSSGPVPDDCPDFPAGSFFWARTSVLKPLFDLGLTVEDFPAETGQVDGTLSHVIERIIGVLPDITGMTTACVAVNVPPHTVDGDQGSESAMLPDVKSLESLPGPGILVFSHNLDGAEGAPTSLYEMCIGLKTQGMSPLVISPSDGSLRAQYEEQGIPVVVANAIGSPLQRLYRDIGYHNTLRADLQSFISKTATELVIANTTLGFHIVQIAISCSVPSIWIIRESEDPMGHFAKSLPAEIRPIFLEALAKVDQLVFVSENTRDAWARSVQLDRNRVSVIPNRLNLARFEQALQKDRSTLRARLGLQDSEVALLNVGTICQRKNQMQLLDALLLLSPDLLKQIKLICVGGLAREAYSKKFIRRIDSDARLRGRVTYVPPTPDIGDYYRAADVFVLTSLFESYPRVTLEAMEFSLPLIVNPVYGVLEQTEEGVNSLSYDPDRTITLAERIMEIMDPDTRRRLSEGSRQQAARLGNYQSMVKCYSELVSRLAARRTATADVSVVVPNYNYERYLPERLGSIINQTVRPREIIFLDDASTDNSVRVARDILEHSPVPFKIIRNQTNAGTYRQWLKGIAAAKGEFIWIAEADDTCEPGMLAALVAAMQDERVVIAYCQSKRIDENGTVTAPDNLHHTNELDPDRWRKDYRELGLREVVDWLVYRNTIPNTSACLLRKSAIGGIEEELSRARFSGDRLLYAHMLRHGDVAYIAKPLNGFRWHRRAVTAGSLKTTAMLDEAARVRRYTCANFPVHRSQLQGIVRFLDKDYRVQGVNKNSEYPAVKSVLEAIEAQVGQTRRFAFIATNGCSFDRGSELWWRESAKRLRALGHDVVILIKKWDPPPPFLDDFARLGIGSYFEEDHGFRRIIEFKPDLVVVSVGDQDEGIEYYGELRQHSIPYIIVNRLTKEPRFWPIRKDRNDRVRDGYLGAQKVFFASGNNSQVMEERLGCKLPHWDIIYSPNHADRNAVVPFPPVSDGLRLAVPANIRFVHKGQDLIVDVMKKDTWRKRDVTINLYGVGEDENRLREMVRKAGLEEKLIFHGKLVFVGREHEISQIWLHNHAILLPSRMEGFANTVIHAMMSGRVPIVTDIGGHGDVIEDGVTGFIASDPTPEALDDAMERAYQRRHEWEEIGRRARQAVLDYLPEDPVADAVDKILQVAGLEPVHAAADAPRQE